MSKKHCSSKTKLIFKLPREIKKGSVINAYSTSADILIEGYIGKIKLINSANDLPKKGILSCRPTGSNNGKAWIEMEL